MPESAKNFIKRTSLKAEPLGFTSDQIERVADILCYGPIRRKPGDEIFVKAGLAEPYEGDADYVDGAPGSADKFYNPVTGGVRACWILPSKRKAWAADEQSHEEFNLNAHRAAEEQNRARRQQEARCVVERLLGS